MSWMLSSVSGESSGGVSFSSTIQVLNADDSICLREMNLDGGFYDTEPGSLNQYEDDDESLDLEGEDEGGMDFLDAVQDQIKSDDANTDFQMSSGEEDYFQRLR